MIRKLYPLHCFIFLAILILGAQSLPAQNTRKVLVIGIDGCRADALRAADAPNIHALLDHAVFSFDALTRFPTWSGPGWSSMCTGVWADKHGVLDNSFAGANYGQYPSFITRVEDQQPAIRSVSIVHWSPINEQINTQADLKLNVPTDLAVKDSAVAHLTQDDPDILFLDFDDVDHAGHTYGFDPSVPEYMASIQLTDVYAGEILAALHARPHFEQEDWLILVTPDHGGNLQGHGNASFEERNIFFIAWQQEQMPEEITRDSTTTALIGGIQLNGADQYLLPTDSHPFQFDSSQDFSLEIRVRYTTLSGDAAFISNKDWDSGLYTGWVVSTPFSDQTHWKVNIGDGITRQDVTGGFIADGNWHHLTVTFNRDSAMTLYQDGNLIGQADISGIGNVDAGLPVVIGQDGTLDYPYFFQGDIAEVRIWNTVLAPETVAAYTCASVDAAHPDFNHLVAYWKMNDGAGNIAANTVSGPEAVVQGAAASWSVQPGQLVCEDFSATPRLVDVAVTALTHLCIPIDSSWELDGRSLVAACVSSHVEQPAAAPVWLQVAPNPATDQVTVRFATLSAPVSLCLRSLQGQLLLQRTVSDAETTLSLAAYPAGSYLLQAVASQGQVITVRINKF